MDLWIALICIVIGYVLWDVSSVMCFRSLKKAVRKLQQVNRDLEGLRINLESFCIEQVLDKDSITLDE